MAVAKRGNMMFVKNGFIFVISTELAERITEGSTYHKTTDEEDTLLRDRLLDIANRIRFLSPSPASFRGRQLGTPGERPCATRPWPTCRPLSESATPPFPAGW